MALRSIAVRALFAASILAGSTFAFAQEAVQWRVEDGGNGHWYVIVALLAAVSSAACLSGQFLGAGEVHAVKRSQMKTSGKIGLAALGAAAIATGAFAQQNGYARFNQTTDTIRIYGNTEFGGVDSTYEMRIRISPDAGSSLGHVISEQRDAYESKTVFLSDSDFVKDTVRGYNCGNENNHTFALGVLSDWRHLAWVRQGAEARLYMDGELVAAWSGQASCTSDYSDSTMSIGMFRNGSPCCWGPLLPSFIGDLDWIRISSGARYSGAFTPPNECDVIADRTTQLLLKFNEPAGTMTLIDESANHFMCLLGIPVEPSTTATSPSLGNPVYGPGSPDPCDLYSVPGEYATIQAAIDAVPSDAFGLVSVAAGTYNESFSLTGKNVVVRGAPKGATILDGTGLATSIARFAGNEPATAGVENLVFRNGTTGSLITPQTTFLVGGGLFGANSSAFIRNCRFEQNGSDFGAGAYLFRCSMLVEDCVFDANTAVREGGGLQVYETTGTVRNTVFSGNRSGVNGPGSGSGFKSVGALANDESVALEGCTVTGCISGVEGSAVEHFENAAARRGVLRLIATSVTANTSGLGAGGVRALGNLGCVVLSEGSEVCANLQGNIDGPYLIEGAATVCDCLADLTGDGFVNGGDLGIVLNSWGVAGPQGYGDVNHDGVIDGADLSLLLSNWGACE
jgi:hypothetical protein